MSRSGYSYNCDGWELIRWRGAVNSAIKGKRGQTFLRELLAALEAMPEKRLIKNALVEADGDVCALGSVGARRGLNMDEIDPYDREQVAKTFGITEALAAEIMNENDETHWAMQPNGADWKPETPEQRWIRVRNWIKRQLGEQS